MMLINLIGYTVIMTITPGPNNIICLAIGSKHGYRLATRFILGITLGCLSMQWLMLILNEFIADKLPIITKYLGYVGAAYMLYLAYKIIKSDGDFSDGDQKIGHKVMGFKEGTFLQYMNPKAYIFNMTIVTGFYSSVALNPLQYILITMLLALIFFVCCSIWALFGHGFKKLFTRYGKLINIVLGGTLVYLAMTIVIH